MVGQEEVMNALEEPSALEQILTLDDEAIVKQKKQVEKHFNDYDTLKPQVDYHANKKTSAYRDLKSDLKVALNLYHQAQSQLDSMKAMKKLHKRVKETEKLRLSADNETQK